MENLKATDKQLAPPKRPSGLDWLKRMDPTNKIVVEYEKRLEAYNLASNIQNLPSIEEYRERIKKGYEKPEYGKIDCEHLYEMFKVCYFHVNEVEFNEESNNGEGRIFARTMLLYFAGSNRFLQSPLLSKKTELSMKKGVMIVGKWGNGKTSVMKTIHFMFSRPISEPIYIKNKDGELYPLSAWNKGFSMFTANQVVDSYEWRSNTEKAEFWTLHTKGVKFYDDLLTERMVSNYGKFEIFKDVLEKRNDKRLRTVITCNYTSDKNFISQFDGKGKDLLDITMFEMGVRYGKRVYDRLFSDFNIIELSGKSMRK